MSIIVDMTGQKYGNLTVVSRAENKDNRNTWWNCVCDCGNTNIVRFSHLTSGNVTSCGCYAIEKSKERLTTHGMSNTKIFNVWYGMIRRCEDTKDNHYKDYGARGISVCDRWHLFENFYTDMGDVPEGMTIDRIDNDGNYEPGNCRWATEKEQKRNRRNTVFLECNNETKPLAEWAEELGISQSVIRQRIKLGWKIKDAVMTPLLNRWDKYHG